MWEKRWQKKNLVLGQARYKLNPARSHGSVISLCVTSPLHLLPSISLFVFFSHQLRLSYLLPETQKQQNVDRKTAKGRFWRDLRPRSPHLKFTQHHHFASHQASAIACHHGAIDYIGSLYDKILSIFHLLSIYNAF